MHPKIIILLLFALLLAACESGPRVRMSPEYEVTATPIQSSANVMGTPAPTRISPTPTVPPLTLDNKFYTLPSLTFSFYPPQTWALDNEDDSYAKFISPDKTAWMEAAVESSGYALFPEDFQTYVDNMVASLYNGAKEYRQLRREDSGGKTIISSTFLKGNQKWYSMDVFYQRSQALYALSFQAYETVWDTYRNTFLEMAENVTTQTGYLKPEEVYKFRRTYQSPSGVFEITVPLGWSVTRDDESLDGGIIETITSPDNEASAEIIILNDQALFEQKDIGQISIGLIKERYGADLTILTNELLEDGRIRTDWENRKTGMSGYTIFWMNASELNILTLKYTDEHPDTYQDVNNGMGSSFVFVKK